MSGEILLFTGLYLRGLPLNLSRHILAMLLAASTVGAEPLDLAARIAVMKPRWEAAMRDAEVPGLAVAVTDRNGVVYSFGFGHRSMNPPLPFEPDTPTYIASVTKVFTAAAIVQLAEQGKVDLDHPVESYLPRFDLKDAALAASITLRDLLCHRYGLSSDPIVFAEAYSGRISDELFYRELPQAEIAGAWEYSNLHFTLLGRVIEAVTGEDWRDYLDDHVFGPLHMKGATARAGALYGSEISAVPLERLDGAWVAAAIRKCDETMHAAGGLGASALDLATWLRAMLGQGAAGDARVLSALSVQEMLSPQARPGTRYLQFDRPEMGLGWYLGRYRGALLVHHFGSYTGAHAHCSFMPSAGIGVAIVANWDGAARPLLHQIAADIYDARLGIDAEDPWPALLRDATRSLKKEDRSVPTPKPLALRLPLAAYEGTYNSDLWGTLELDIEGDRLKGRIGNLPITFLKGRRDHAEIDTPLGGKSLRFETAGEEISGITIEKVWGRDLAFQRAGSPNP